MNIEMLRLRAANVVGATGLLLGLLVVALDWFMQGSLGMASVIAVTTTLALGVTFAIDRKGQTFRFVTVSVLMSQVMALLIAMRGNPLQIDVHMMFFAALAICGLMFDVRAILLGTALVAVRHLGLGLLMERHRPGGQGASRRDRLHDACRGSVPRERPQGGADDRGRGGPHRRRPEGPDADDG